MKTQIDTMEMIYKTPKEWETLFNKGIPLKYCELPIYPNDKKYKFTKTQF